MSGTYYEEIRARIYTPKPESYYEQLLGGLHSRFPSFPAPDTHPHVTLKAVQPPAGLPPALPPAMRMDEMSVSQICGAPAGYQPTTARGRKFRHTVAAEVTPGVPAAGRREYGSIVCEHCGDEVTRMSHNAGGCQKKDCRRWRKATATVKLTAELREIKAKWEATGRDCDHPHEERNKSGNRKDFKRCMQCGLMVEGYVS